ncbi:AI-2E family transporter [Canibacter oris]|uniref:Putative PurR-regulated permease PerM n=1 Tax=Canibacter oris TaxID=1365628 RepID=A0A840DE67_9MICO|nr:AI-2E family transporter [Canibacter oris]MBB4070940.1 putative PurR-regulated permease PerM [Canibacter oris]
MKKNITRLAKALKPVTGSLRVIDPQQLDDHPEVKRVDKQRLDKETLAIYNHAREAAEAHAEQVAEHGDGNVRVLLNRPFQFGFVATAGVLFALLCGLLVSQASTVLLYICGALFVALGLDPLVRRLENRGVKRPWAIAVVFFSFFLVVAIVLSIIIPTIVQQVSLLVQTAPAQLEQLATEEWFIDLKQRFAYYVDFEVMLEKARDVINDQKNWFSVAGGVLQIAGTIANGVTAAIIVLILSLYFLASLRSMKRGFYSLTPLSKRARVIDITEQVADSVGGYITGQVIIALTNAVLGFIAMSIIGVPFAPVLATVVFMLALIPLVGALGATVLVTTVALFESPGTALAIGIYYLIYMQLEAYVLTPRVMNRAVSVPGAFVVIGALTGGVLLGLMGALIAIPVTASILMIVKQVWVPHQDSR